MTHTSTTLLVYVVMTALQNVKEHIDLLQKKVHIASVLELQV